MNSPRITTVLAKVANSPQRGEFLCEKSPCFLYLFLLAILSILSVLSVISVLFVISLLFCTFCTYGTFCTCIGKGLPLQQACFYIRTSPNFFFLFCIATLYLFDLFGFLPTFGLFQCAKLPSYRPTGWWPNNIKGFHLNSKVRHIFFPLTSLSPKWTFLTSLFVMPCSSMIFAHVSYFLCS